MPEASIFCNDCRYDERSEKCASVIKACEVLLQLGLMKHLGTSKHLVSTFRVLISSSMTPHIVLLKKIDGLRDCTIAVGSKRGTRREHVLSERVEYVNPRFWSRDAN
ncbi:hypothetical protein Y032_0021g433 [Ancylostoma ceylanicum]|nr:hypothetical protein Y032_0021g433 [Ancylostoma ceylanicum]